MIVIYLFINKMLVERSFTFLIFLVCKGDFPILPAITCEIFKPGKIINNMRYKFPAYYIGTHCQSRFKLVRQSVSVYADQAGTVYRQIECYIGLNFFAIWKFSRTGPGTDEELSHIIVYFFCLRISGQLPNTYNQQKQVF